MNRRMLAILVAVVVILGAAYAYASPYLTVTKMTGAAEQRDSETINAHVDFPALRQSFKEAIGAVMAKEMMKPEVKMRW